MSVQQYIAILEDDPRRVAAMKLLLDDYFPALVPIFFDRSADFIKWIQFDTEQVVLLSLDHDLPFVRQSDGSLDDYGTGREVADYLALQTPHCPIVIHTSNAQAGDGMQRVLTDAGWILQRVHPRDDLAWIAQDWRDAVHALHLRVRSIT